MSKPYKPGISGTLPDLRSKAIQLLWEQNAILVIANCSQRMPPAEVDSQIQTIEAMRNHKELKALIASLKEAVTSLRRTLGVRAPKEHFFGLIGWITENISSSQACYMPIGVLREYLSSYDQMEIPPHARLSLDLHCIGRNFPGGFEVRLLEVSLFEDMCALFNECHAAFDAIPRLLPLESLKRKTASKRHAALMRATFTSAFYFVEAYINCLASDFVYKHKEQISEKDLVYLTEWDNKKNRHRSVSTKEKLIQYPRIITNSTIPPIDESTCPELAFFCSTAKDFRDAIVHASPTFDAVEGIPKKERLLGSMNQEDVSRVVDSAVTIVSRIETLINARSQFWLISRDESGRFPDAVFE